MELSINGTRLFYLDQGKPTGTPIIFLHAFPTSHEMWVEQVELLKAGFRVVAYDHRGQGQSSPGDGQFTLEFLVDDLIGLLDQLKIRRAVLCGLSIGGYVALRTAERNPERLAGLILCDTRSEGDSNEAKLKRSAALRTIKNEGIPAFAEQFLKALFAPASFASRPAAVEEVRQLILQTSAQGLCGSLLALVSRTDTTPALAHISVPTLILVGENDAVTPPAAAEAMHKLIPGSELAVIPAAGHLSNLENPNEFNAHLRSFMARFA